MLSPSLEGRPPIPLPVRVPPGPHLPQGIPQDCFTGIWLKALFRESKRRLLLSARAGGGKTIALLQLLQLLLQDRGSGQSAGPVPVVLDATSWRPAQSIRQWIVHELDRLYGVRQSTANEFVENKQLIYLIDGLDQIGMRSRLVSAGDRASADEVVAPGDAANDDRDAKRLWVQRMREFIDEGQWSVTQQAPIALCCREDLRPEFAELLDSGQFQTVLVEPAGIQDIIATVRADPTVPGLAQQLERNPQIADLACVPLFLQMLLSVFRQGSPYRPLANATEGEQIRELISSYVELRLAGEHPQWNAAGFTIPRVRRWLSWLAQNQNRSPFLVELMQPDMLTPPDQRRCRWLAATLLGAALTICAVLPAAAGLGVEWGFHRGPATGLRVGLLAAAAVTGLVMVTSVPVFLLTRGMWFGFWISAAFSLVRGIIVGAGCPDGELPTGWSVGARAAAFTWLAIGLPWMAYGHYTDYRVDVIHPLSNWNFNMRRGRVALLLGVSVGLVFWYFYGPARGVTFGTMTSLLLGGSLCLQRTGLDVPNQPNHAVRRSLKNAATFALSAVLIAAPIVVASYAYQFGWQDGLTNGLLALSALVAALMFGGIPVLQHAALRLVGANREHMPLRFVDFLNAMSELMLLQRVGGAYRFSHDLVRAFFAQGRPPRA